MLSACLKMAAQHSALVLQFFEGEGCRMVEMGCEDHDRIAASTQFMTHTVGRILGSMDLASTAIDTKGFQSLLSLVDNTTHDSFELYYGLFMYNAVCPLHLSLMGNLQKLWTLLDMIAMHANIEVRSCVTVMAGLQASSCGASLLHEHESIAVCEA